MTEIRFYHMERSSLEHILPGLLGKALERGHKIIVQSDTQSRVEAINAHLWSYDPNSFIPHGSAKDGHAEQQPIWLTDKQDNPNGADLLILTHGATNDNLKDFDLCCEMLDGHDEASISTARMRWKAYKDQGFSVTYWQQSAQGAWEKQG